MTELARRLFVHIRSMGAENRWEDGKSPNCVSTLNELLPAQKERYPEGTYVGPRGRPGICDVVFEGTWLEVKFAWTYVYEPPFDKWNKPYRKHLVGPDES